MRTLQNIILMEFPRTRETGLVQQISVYKIPVILISHAMTQPRLVVTIGSLLFLATLQLTFAQQSHAAPAFLWSSGPFIGGISGAERQVSYEV